MRHADIFLFDLDGTLADSISIMKEVYYFFAATKEFTPSYEEFALLNGPSIEEIVYYLCDQHSLSKSFEFNLELYKSIIKTSYSDVVLFPMAEELLIYLRSCNKKIFLVTSSESNIAINFLEQKGLESYFDGFIFGDMVKFSKPSGEIYKNIISKYCIDKNVSVAVEDSTNGVLSASESGLSVVGIGDRQELLSAGASEVFVSLKEMFFELVFGDKIKFIDCNDPIRINILTEGAVNTSQLKKGHLVDEIWENALKQDSTLFNGVLYCFDSLSKGVNKNVISLFSTEYKYFFAQRKGFDFGLVPIGVSGMILFSHDETLYTLIARRSERVTQYSGKLELVPSGGLSDFVSNMGKVVDPVQSLLNEFEEELGLSRKIITQIRFLGMLEDKKDNVIDLCYALHCETSLEYLDSLLKLSDEYDNYSIVKVDDVAKVLISEVDNGINPISLAIAIKFLDNI